MIAHNETCYISATFGSFCAIHRFLLQIGHIHTVAPPGMVPRLGTRMGSFLPADDVFASRMDKREWDCLA